MKRWLTKHVRRPMVSPIISVALSRFLTALALALAWNRFFNARQLLKVQHAYTVAGAVFFSFVWVNYLRLDGVNIPRLGQRLSHGLTRVKKRTIPAYSDMLDYVDEEIVSFHDLSQEERDVSCLVANAACGVVFLALAFLT